MRPKVLKNKPLLEAILELKWNPQLSAQSNGVDSDLRLFLGRFHDLVSKEYSAFEVLPAASVPDQMAPNVPQYRFRKTLAGWPLIQLGSGLLALNETASYTWEDYRARAQSVIELLFLKYPRKLELTTLELRYINAVYADFEAYDVVRYLADKFKVQLSLPGSLFQESGVELHPTQFALQTSFATKSPMGSIRFSIARGKANDRDAIVWETIVQSAQKQLPRMPEEFSEWLDAAHTVAEDWFFKLVDGELLKQFCREDEGI
jgi:uncharacterized protein (TIGR04255 family)